MKKIVVIGPESTGKSTLCRQLASHFQADWIPEYARNYLLKNGTNYTYADLLTIARGQVSLEENYIASTREARLLGNGAEVEWHASLATPDKHLLFIDTEMYVLKVWCEFVFGNCHLWILNQIVTLKYDLYLLCNVDLPWKKDELREYPDLKSREILFHMYRDILINQPVPWIDIHGTGNERLQKAIDGISHFLL